MILDLPGTEQAIREHVQATRDLGRQINFLGQSTIHAAKIQAHAVLEAAKIQDAAIRELASAVDHR